MRTRTEPNSIGNLTQLATFENPGAPVSDGEGGYTETWDPLDPPTAYVRIRQATAKDAEDVVAGTVITHVSHIVHLRFHPEITTKTRMHCRGQIYQVTQIENIDFRDHEMELVADLQGTPNVG